MCRDGRCERCLEYGITEYEYDSIDEFEKHQDACLDEDGSCFNFVNYKKKVGVIEHKEEGHYETVTVTEAYNEQKLVSYLHTAEKKEKDSNRLRNQEKCW